MKSVALLSLCSILILSGLSSAEDRQKDAPKTSFTNEDLDARHPTPRPTEGSPSKPVATSPPASSGANLENPEAPPDESITGSTAASGSGGASAFQDPAYWRQRAAAAHGAIAQAKQKVKDLEAKIELAKSPFRPGVTYSWYLPNPDVKPLEAALEGAKNQLAAAENELRDLESDAREAGISPAWIEP